MKINKILSIVVAALILFNGMSYACTFKGDFSDETPLNAAVRSALFPGWGQHFNEQPTKGWIVAGAFVASVAGAFYFNSQAESKYDEYEKRGLINDSLYDDYKNNDNLSKTFTYAAIGIYLYAVIDAYFVAKSKEKDKDYVFNIYYDQENRAPFVKYGRKFNI